MSGFNGKKFAQSLPILPGVYQMLNKHEKVIYVGKASSLRSRVSSYFSGKPQDNKTMALIQHTHSMRYHITRSQGEALILENQLIKKHKPRYNVLLKDGKSYPYIYCSINEDPFPKLEFRRGAKKGTGKYFGPFPSAYSVRATLNQLQKIFKVRQCDNTTFSNRSRPCLQHQINRCTAPCVNYVSKQEYDKQVEHTELFLNGKSIQVIKQLIKHMDHMSAQQKYEQAAQLRDQIQSLRLVQSQQIVESNKPLNIDIFTLGNKAGITIVTVGSVRNGQILGYRNFYPKITESCIPEEIISAFIGQYYYDKPVADSVITSLNPSNKKQLVNALNQINNKKIQFTHNPRSHRKKLLEQTLINMQDALEKRVKKYASWHIKWQEWVKTIGLKKPPDRVECFDISHTFGDETRASCVVFNKQGPMKQQYRHYIITDITGGDDYAAMHQVIEKRLNSINKHQMNLPDVLLIDGGKGQVHQTEKKLKQNKVKDIEIIGVIKDENRKAGQERLYLNSQKKMIQPKAHSMVSLMVQFIRDEAHRFAINSHRKALKKAKKTSLLESIPGIGIHKRTLLLKQFGGLQGLKKATLEDIQNVRGINKKLAELVYKKLLSTKKT